MIPSKTFIIYGGITFILSLLLTRLMIWVNIADIPGERSSHAATTPRGGGVALVASFLIVVLVAYGYGTFEGVPPKSFLVVFFSSLFMAFTGFIDDARGLSWFTRALVQCLLALTVVLAGVTLPTITLPYFGKIELGIGGDILAVFWILGLTNAFNFMDGINGISGGVALTASLALLFIIQVDPLLFFVIGLLPFAILGFLIFNFPKGKIFLGDVGSQFLGFVFACLGLILPLQDPQLSPWLMPLLFCIYLFDTCVTLIRRFCKGDNIFTAHRGHFYQLLVRAGYSHATVTGIYCFLFIAQGWLSLQMLKTLPAQHIYFFIPLLSVYTLGAISIIKYAKRFGIDI